MGPLARILGELWLAYRFSRDRFDVLLAPFNFVPPTWPGPSVVIEHNVLAVRPEHVTRLRAWYRPRALSASLRRATEVIVVSAYLREMLLQHFPWLDPATVHVVPTGVPRKLMELAPPRRSRQHIRVLCVGALWPYKRLDQAIGAFAEACRDLEGAELLIVGPGERSVHRELTSLAASLDVAEKVRFIGNIQHERLADLYVSSDALLFLSEIESFGLPVLEAMALGVPVVARKIGGVAEVGGDAPVWIRNGSGVTEIAELLRALLTSAEFAEERRRAGLEQSTRFEWDTAARQIAESLMRAAASSNEAKGATLHGKKRAA
jgi:glycosyltransferase involved in cell wall biosynthesis